MEERSPGAGRPSKRDRGSEEGAGSDAGLAGAGYEARVESMGWITESSVMPKKGRVIEGVGTGSLVELRAQLYRSQEDAKRASMGEPVPGRIRTKDPFAAANSGVEDRARRDMLQLKAEQDGSKVRSALEKKAELYEKIRRGEIPDEEEGEKYAVDFLRKGYLEDEKREMEEERQAPGNAGEAPGPAPSAQLQPNGPTHKSLIREVNEETKAAREQVSLLKQQREVQAKKRQEKLRAAFLKKQEEKKKQAKQRAQPLS